MDQIPTHNHLKALVFSPEAPSSKSTGLILRTLQIARYLQNKGIEVHICSKGLKGASDFDCGFQILDTHEKDFFNKIQGYQILVCNGLNFGQTPQFFRFQGLRIVDMIVPFPWEHMVSKPHRRKLDLAILKNVWKFADIVLFAGVVQRNHYQNSASSMFSGIDQTMEFVELPFEIKPRPNNSTARLNKIAWVGGFYPWFDPKPFLESIPELLKNQPSLQIDFIGATHPHESELCSRESLELLQKLTDKHSNQLNIIDWMNYSEYLEKIQEYKLVINLHKNSSETNLSIRTRFIELLEFKIPLIVSPGGYFSNWINQYKLGKVLMRSNDVGQAILSFLEDLRNSEDPENSYEELYKAHESKTLENRIIEAIELKLKGLPQRLPGNKYGLRLQRLQFLFSNLPKRVLVAKALAKLKLS